MLHETNHFLQIFLFFSQTKQRSLLSCNFFLMILGPGVLLPAKVAIKHICYCPKGKPHLHYDQKLTYQNAHCTCLCRISLTSIYITLSQGLLKIMSAKNGGSRPPLPPLSSNVSICQTTSSQLVSYSACALPRLPELTNKKIQKKTLIVLNYQYV